MRSSINMRRWEVEVEGKGVEWEGKRGGEGKYNGQKVYFEDGHRMMSRNEQGVNGFILYCISYAYFLNFIRITT